MLNSPNQTIVTEDPRLTAALHRDPTRYATIAEYATATGIAALRIIDLLTDYLDAGTLALEIVGDELFLHTAPNGRSPLAGPGPVPANLWELLRAKRPINEALIQWRLVRDLERAGWSTECRPPYVLAELSPMTYPPAMGVLVGTNVVPVLAYPTVEALADPAGPLDDFEVARARAVAVVTHPGQLEPALTALRRHLLLRRPLATTTILILEAPAFNPIMMSSATGAVEARSVSRISLDVSDLT